MNLISSTKLKIKRARLSFGDNAVLDEAEKSRQFKQFRKGIEKAILLQIRGITKDLNFVDQVMNLAIKVEEPNPLVVKFLDKKWIALGIAYDKIVGDNKFLSFFDWAGGVGGQAGLDAIGITARPFLLRNPEVKAFLANRSNLLIQTVDNTTKEQLSRLFVEGQRDLLTSFELSEAIDKKFKQISKVRAQMIAQTELANAVNAVQYETFVRNGVTAVRWVTVLDDRVCPICMPLHNQVQRLNNNFTGTTSDRFGFENVVFDGLRPPAHIRCRCFLEEVIEDFAPNRNNEIVWTGE